MLIRALTIIAALAVATPAVASASTWQLVMIYRGDAFVLDHGLTLADCVAARPAGDPAKHVAFVCERA